LCGGTEKDIEKFKQEYGFNENVMIVGKKDHNEIPIYLKAADILVLPNNKGEMISMYYTSPLKLFEYMASKRPIIASKLPSLQEILDEKLCYFFEPGDPKDLAKMIYYIKNNYGETEKKCLNAYEKVKNHTWQKRAFDIIQSIK
jgi:glycosyltransferase involved in cell wall biosynthesis